MAEQLQNVANSPSQYTKKISLSSTSNFIQPSDLRYKRRTIANVESRHTSSAAEDLLQRRQTWTAGGKQRSVDQMSQLISQLIASKTPSPRSPIYNSPHAKNSFVKDNLKSPPKIFKSTSQLMEKQKFDPQTHALSLNSCLFVDPLQVSKYENHPGRQKQAKMRAYSKTVEAKNLIRPERKDNAQEGEEEVPEKPMPAAPPSSPRTVIDESENATNGTPTSARQRRSSARSVATRSAPEKDES